MSENNNCEEYIVSRDFLAKHKKELYDLKGDEVVFSSGPYVTLEDIYNNAAPVVHGQWIWTERGDEDYEQYFVCSKCGQQQYVETNYCPDCGAKMDGGKDAKET